MKKVYVIAEAEINHNGDFEIAKKMIESATMCGADCIKFQYIIAEEIAEKNSEYFDLFKKAELTLEEFVLLRQYAENVCNIDFMITAPSQKTYDRLRELNFNKIKIGSSNLTNLLLLNHISLNRISPNEELFISTGASDLVEIGVALKSLRANELNCNLTVFHCTSLYPAPLNELNLNVIPRLINLYPSVSVGYSDHTKGSVAAIASVTLGASVIEKHFTLDKKMKGPDHFFSSDPVEFKEYIENIRSVEKALGDGVKKPSVSEEKIVNGMRRYLIFNRSIKVGVKLDCSMFDTKRIGGKKLQEEAVKASEISIIEKLKSAKKYNKGDALIWSDFSG